MTIIGTLALALSLMWATTHYGKDRNFYPRYKTLKGRAGRVQAVLIGGQTGFVIALALGAVWISHR